LLINNFEGLRAVGIHALTGEIDKLSMRVLCDLDDKGITTVTEYLGLPQNTKFYPGWNGAPGCILLEPAAITGLAVVGILKHYPELNVVIRYGEVIGTSQRKTLADDIFYPPMAELLNPHGRPPG
jgi:hypothetical protein